MRTRRLAALLVLACSGAVAGSHTVAPGDTLYRIAALYGTTVEALQRANNLGGVELRPGQVLLVPDRPVATPAAATLAPALTGRHTVAPGETLYRIAAAYGTTPAALVAANRLVGPDLKIGQVLAVPASPSATPLPRLALAHTVAPGETLYGLAARYGVGLEELRRANRLGSDELKVGQVLSVPGALPRLEFAPPTPVAPAPPPAVTAPPLPSLADLRPAPALEPVARAATHTVAPGENLYRIGLRYGVSPASIAAANGLSSEAVAAGQILRIPGAPLGPVASSGLRGVAERYLGVPYRIGGATAAGLDCSGFTSLVFAQLGVRLPRTSAEQFATGLPVEPGLLREGDLVFFDTTGAGVSHVGIYLGEGRFIHAATFPAEVTVSALEEPYWAARFLGARRVLGP